MILILYKTLASDIRIFQNRVMNKNKEQRHRIIERKKAAQHKATNSDNRDMG